MPHEYLALALIPPYVRISAWRRNVVSLRPSYRNFRSTRPCARLLRYVIATDECNHALGRHSSISKKIKEKTYTPCYKAAMEILYVHASNVGDRGNC